MDALRASYGDTSSDSDTEPDSGGGARLRERSQAPAPLPPPPLALLDPPNSLGNPGCAPQRGQFNRVRNFPHVEGNYALHVYIPVHIPLALRKEVAQFLKRVTPQVPELQAVDVDVPLNELIKDDKRFEQVVLAREFHVSLGRTIPIRVHQRDSMVNMLRQRLQSQRRYYIDFNKWEVFVNDDCTRTFLSIEVTAGGLPEITKQIQSVNEVYKLHNLPEFYKNPRPHISIAWALGDISDNLKRVVEEEMEKCVTNAVYQQKRIFTTKFSGITCKIGCKVYEICKVQDG